VSEATYSIPRHPDHTATVRQVGMRANFAIFQAVCPCFWTGQAYGGRLAWPSGTDARNRAERDAAAHRRSNG